MQQDPTDFICNTKLLALKNRNYRDTTTACKNSGDTLPSWGVFYSPDLSHTAPPTALSLLLAIQNHTENLNSQH